MDIQIEPTLVVRMTKLEAARTLVNPEGLQLLLRAKIQTEGDNENIIEGKSIVRALPAGSSSGNGGRQSRSPHVRKALRQLSKGSRRVKCDFCPKMVKPGIGKAVHEKRAHPLEVARRKAGES